MNNNFVETTGMRYENTRTLLKLSYNLVLYACKPFKQSQNLVSYASKRNIFTFLNLEYIKHILTLITNKKLKVLHAIDWTGIYRGVNCNSGKSFIGSSADSKDKI